MSARAESLEAEARQLTEKAAALRGAADNVRKGNEGEMVVGERLDVLDGAGWHVLHDRRKSMSSPANIDHVVVGPSGVFVIDTKNWSGGLLRLDERGMKLGSWRKDDALHAARVDAELVQRLVWRAMPGVHVRGVLAFVQDVGLTEPREHRNVALVQELHLLGWLTGLPKALNREQVELLARLLDRELPPRQRAPLSAVPATSSAMVRQVRRTGKRPAPARRRRSGVGRDAFHGVIKFALVAAVVVTLPTTLPVLQDNVLQPLVDRMAGDFAEQFTPPATTPAPPQPTVPAR